MTGNPYEGLPDDFQVPSFPPDVQLPDEMRDYQLQQVRARQGELDELIRLVELATLTRDRAILNARITTNLTLEEIGEAVGLTKGRISQIETEQRERACDGSRRGGRGWVT